MSSLFTLEWLSYLCRSSRLYDAWINKVGLSNNGSKHMQHVLITWVLNNNTNNKYKMTYYLLVLVNQYVVSLPI